MDALDPRVARMKERLLTAPYEVCMARALRFTRAYRETEGLDPHLRNARALARTLDEQEIFIWPDERIAGSKTERYLAGPLSVERGDFLRTLQLEMDVLHKKRRPFHVTAENRRLFYEEVLPYWDGRTVRDRKAAHWVRDGLLDTAPGLRAGARRILNLARNLHVADRDRLRKLFGAALDAPLTPRRLRTLYDLRYEYARNNPTPAVFCFDVQGHLCLGVDKVVERGMGALIEDARARKRRLSPDQAKEHAFLDAVILSLQAACRYSERFTALAEKMSRKTDDPAEKHRLETIASNCRVVPRARPESFHQALQSLWMTLLVGEIQYGTHEVFGVGRIDQYLWPYYRDDLRAGRLGRGEALALCRSCSSSRPPTSIPSPRSAWRRTACSETPSTWR